MAAKRVRQIREGSEYLVSSPKNEDIVVALREIAAGKVFLKQNMEAEIEALEEAVKKKVEAKAKEVEAKAEEVNEKTEEADEKTEEVDENESEK
jgi:DNA-directed RNA polymerase subunit omega